MAFKEEEKKIKIQMLYKIIISFFKGSRIMQYNLIIKIRNVINR